MIQIQHINPDAVVIGDLNISITSDGTAINYSLDGINSYVKVHYGVENAVQAARDFVRKFYDVPIVCINRCDFRIFLIGLVCYIMGKTKMKMSVRFCDDVSHVIYGIRRTNHDVYTNMFRAMWQREPVVAKISASYSSISQWIMTNNVEEEKQKEDVQFNYSTPLCLKIKKPDIRLNFD